MSYNDGVPNNRPINTVATYHCNTGYTLNGESSRTCDTSGKWNGSAPICTGLWRRDMYKSKIVIRVFIL